MAPDQENESFLSFPFFFLPLGRAPKGGRRSKGSRREEEGRTRLKVCNHIVYIWDCEKDRQDSGSLSSNVIFPLAGYFLRARLSLPPSLTYGIVCLLPLLRVPDPDHTDLNITKSSQQP